MNINRAFIRESFLKGSAFGVLSGRSSEHALGIEEALGASWSCSHPDDIADANEVVGRIGKGEHPPSQLQPFVPDLSQRPNRFEPSKTLLDKLAFPLTDLVPWVSGGTLIKCTASSSLRILSCMKA